MYGIHRYVNYINVLILICLIIIFVFFKAKNNSVSNFGDIFLIIRRFFIRDLCLAKDDYAVFNNCGITK